MLDFFLAELRRFRTGAIVYCLGNLVGLAILQQMVDIPNGPVGLHVMLLAFYMVSGLGFAAFQFGSYRQPSRWIWLQHRPVHRARILAALVLAAAAVIALAVGFPLCALLRMQEHFTRNVIDTRHYAGAAYLTLSALSAWLAGGIIMLHRSRWMGVVLLLPLVLTVRMAGAATVLGLTVACVAVLLGLLYTVFRPERSAANDAAATAASALPLQASIYVALLWAGSFLYQAGLMAVGCHPQAQEPPAAGTFSEARRFDATEALQAGVAGTADPRAAGWRAALTKHTAVSFGPISHQYGVRNLMTAKGMAQFADGETLWVFSHDRMQYHGINVRTRADRGWFGTGGPGTPGRFETAPAGLGDNRNGKWILDAHNLYRSEDAGTRLHHVLRVDGQEQLGGRLVEVGQRLLVLTNRRLAILAPDSGVPATELPLPLPYGDLQSAFAAQVQDGTLVTFIYGLRQSDRSPAAAQVTFLVDLAAREREVGRRTLAHDYPPLFEHRAWWISPALDMLVSVPDLLIDNGTVPDFGAGRFAPLLQARPAIAWAAALAATLLAGAGAAWWTRRSDLPRRSRAAWCVACLLLGMPALLSLMILQPRRYAAAVRPPAAVAAAG
jgi:hypothetical protein